MVPAPNLPLSPHNLEMGRKDRLCRARPVLRSQPEAAMVLGETSPPPHQDIMALLPNL